MLPDPLILLVQLVARTGVLTYVPLSAGTAHVLAIILCVTRMGLANRSKGVEKFRLSGSARAVHCLAAIAAAANLLLVLFLLNGRIAADTILVVHGKLAPFEWVGKSSWLPLTSSPSCNLCHTQVPHPVSQTAFILMTMHFILVATRYSVSCPCSTARQAGVFVLASCQAQCCPNRSSFTKRSTGLSHKLLNSILVLPAGFGLSSVSWLVFTMTFLFDLSRYSLERTWLWRFPLVLIAAGQVAQLR